MRLLSRNYADRLGARDARHAYFGIKLFERMDIADFDALRAGHLSPDELLQKYLGSDAEHQVS